LLPLFRKCHVRFPLISQDGLKSVPQLSLVRCAPVRGPPQFSLSLRERARVYSSLSFWERAELFLPLPLGEGRGEGAATGHLLAYTNSFKLLRQCRAGRPLAPNLAASTRPFHL
jgi:hypothetical protein